MHLMVDREWYGKVHCLQSTGAQRDTSVIGGLQWDSAGIWDQTVQFPIAAFQHVQFRVGKDWWMTFDEILNEFANLRQLDI